MTEEQLKAYTDAISKLLDLGVTLGLDNETIADIVDQLLNPDEEEKEEEDETQD